jgi:hypothetical protein
MKSIVASSIVFLIFIGTMSAFKYWESNELNYAYSLNGYELLSVENNLEEGITLRPKGAILSTNQVDEITYTYTYKIKKELNISEFIQEKTLVLNQERIDDQYGLVTVEIMTQTVIHETTDYYILEVEAMVYLREASNQEEMILYSQLHSFNVALKPLLNH